MEKMKKSLMMVMAALAMTFAGCSDDKGNDGGEPTPPPAGNEAGLVFDEKEGTQTIGYIGNGNKHFPAPKGDYVLDAGKKYVLRGWVYIQDGSTLTIPAGTVIKGDKQTAAALIIERGAKIIARGTAQKPIVFTSEQPAGGRKPGDWGGLILCGRASNNKGEQQIEGGPRSFHGGGKAPVDNDDSGVLSYVRVEFAGYPFDTDKEINGITFGSVGSGTQVDHLQVSYSNDDSFEWFGGSVSCKYLVAYHGWDDDFDTDNGFSGRMQFLLGVRHPRLADKSLSNGFESDNNADGSAEEPYTTARFCNVTLIGPMGQDAAFFNTSATASNPDGYINAGELYPNNGSGLGQFQAGVQIRRNSRISLYNSVVTGWPVALMIEKDKGDSPAAALGGKFDVRDVHFAGVDTTLTAFDNAEIDPLQGILSSDKNKTWLKGNAFADGILLDKARANRFYKDMADIRLVQPVSTGAGFNPRPATGSPLVDATLRVPSGFDAKGDGYAGAFRDASDDWTAGWTNFDPQNTVY